jgi:hypothetical protein
MIIYHFSSYSSKFSPERSGNLKISWRRVDPPPRRSAPKKKTLIACILMIIIFVATRCTFRIRWANVQGALGFPQLNFPMPCRIIRARYDPSDVDRPRVSHLWTRADDTLYRQVIDGRFTLCRTWWSHRHVRRGREGGKLTTGGSSYEW